MARTGTSVTADAIRIEDEVWQEAFQTRVPSRRPRGASGDLTLEPFVPTEHPVAAPGPMVDFDAEVVEDGWLERALLGSARERESATRFAARPVPAAPAVSLTPVVAARAAEPAAGQARRTVRIQGRGDERHTSWAGQPARRRPPKPLHERAAFRPDRVAMWAVFLGLLLLFVAAVSGHG